MDIKSVDGSSVTKHLLGKRKVADLLLSSDETFTDHQTTIKALSPKRNLYENYFV